MQSRPLIKLGIKKLQNFLEATPLEAKLILKSTVGHFCEAVYHSKVYRFVRKYMVLLNPIVETL